jgi:uncharacterized protein
MNLDCNLACRYCFEGKRKGKFYMSRETANEFVEFVRNAIYHPHPNPLPSRAREKKGRFPTLEKGGEGGFFGDRGFEDLHITFYGGEPLLSRELIIYIAEKVKALAETRKIPFGFSLQTNGTLLKKETVKRLKPLGLKDAYITIDGPKENHNRFRPYKKGGGSFDAIFRNIKEASRNIEVMMGGNLKYGLIDG